MSEEKIREYQLASKSDKELLTVDKYLRAGWPTSKYRVDPQAQRYFKVRHEITKSNGLYFKSEKVIVPEEKRKEVLNTLHQIHIGV